MKIICYYHIPVKVHSDPGLHYETTHRCLSDRVREKKVRESSALYFVLSGSKQGARSRRRVPVGTEKNIALGGCYR